MHRKWMLISVPFATAISLVSFALHAAPNRGICQQVMSACRYAGFVQGGARTGNGLWKDCINPIMHGSAQRGATLPLPRVSPSIVAACRASNPSCGQPKWARDWYGAPTLARPVPPAFAGGSKPKTLEKPAEVATEKPGDSKTVERPTDTAEA